jgi:hypothetical protein
MKSNKKKTKQNKTKQNRPKQIKTKRGRGSEAGVEATRFVT